jgi:hypothetical protein
MVFVVLAVAVAYILLKLHLGWVLLVLAVGGFFGLRAGTWWGLWRLAEYERRQRHYRVSRWRHGR